MYFEMREINKDLKRHFKELEERIEVFQHQDEDKENF